MALGRTRSQGPDFATGLECCLEAPPAVIAGRRFGLLMNQASVDRRFRYAHRLLAERFPGRLVALFGPQHGLLGAQQDNMVETPHGEDPVLGVPVYSLYADRRRPTAAMLHGLELFVVDLQDVGTRIYTFIWTVTHCLEACAEQGIPVLVLDRPNPIGGRIVEGPLLDPAFASFVGRAPIPMRHGLTIGELAGYLNEAMGIGAEVHVVPMRGWQREMLWTDLGRVWVPTSPNLPRFEGVVVYPGQVLIEGTRLSEGRGTTTPFEVVGAPFVAAEQLVRALARFALEGVTLRPVAFEPTFQKHAGRTCLGLFLHPHDPREARSYRWTLALLGVIRELYADRFEWLPPPYEYEEELMPIDILTGSSAAREAIDAGLGVAALDEITAVDAAEWTDRTAAHALYGNLSLIE